MRLIAFRHGLIPRGFGASPCHAEAPSAPALFATRVVGREAGTARRLAVPDVRDRVSRAGFRGGGQGRVRDAARRPAGGTVGGGTGADGYRCRRQAPGTSAYLPAHAPGPQVDNNLPIFRPRHF
ncbi:hypothetical protein GCM10010349_39630 [Streptomyces flavofungini]|nr:hypothetical protein GCM10010349_39630 [Streptomyces flavofungini]